MTTEFLEVADIYCGAGGLSAGFAKASIELPSGGSARYKIVYGLDKDVNAIKAFNEYHKKDGSNSHSEIGQCISVTDAQEESWLLKPSFPKIAVLIGGPNCQGVSAAGLRNPNDERNEMFRYYRDLVADRRPEWFVMENVPGLAHANNRKLLRAIMAAFAEIPGYEVAADVLLAAHYGVPQFRYRLFVVGTRTGKLVRFPDPFLSKIKEFKTVRDAIKDLQKIKPSGDCDEEREGFYNHCVVTIGRENKERIRAIRQGEDWREMPVELLPARFFATRASDQKGSYGRLAWNWPAYTITSATANVTAGPFIHPTQDRPLTVREAARLQGFDDDHVFYGKIAAQYRQVGNAVPPPLAQAVAETILRSHFLDPMGMGQTHEGKITLDLLDKKSKRSFPMLTPRFIPEARKWEHKPLKYPRKEQPKAKKIDLPWKTEKRPQNPYPQDVPMLRQRAEQSGNLKEAVRSRAILGYLDGESRDWILRKTSKSAVSIKKAVREFYEGGLDGWRAYHSPIVDQFQDQPRKQQLIGASIRLVRAPAADNLNGDGKGERLHMNQYLKQLIEKFRALSTRELIMAVEEKESRGIGTVYVQDLLAVAAVCLTDEFVPLIERSIAENLLNNPQLRPNKQA